MTFSFCIALPSCQIMREKSRLLGRKVDYERFEAVVNVMEKNGNFALYISLHSIQYYAMAN